MKGLKGLRFLIVGGLIFFIGCGGYQGSSSIKELETDKPSAQSQVIGTLSDTKGSDTVESADEVELLIKKGEIEEKEKILVDQFEIGENEGFSSMWCGSNALIVKRKNEDIEWISISEKKRLKISESMSYGLLDCTPDGRWVIYVDIKSQRLAPWLQSHPHIECQEKGWLGYIQDVYRYELNSGKKEKIGIKDACSLAVISPDGNKIFLGRQLRENIDMPEMLEPTWERLYFKEKDWEMGDNITWFQDSSGVVTDDSEMYDGEGKLYIEIFGDDGWSKVINAGVVDNIYGLQGGKNKTIYFIATEKRQEDSKFSIYKCNISKKGKLTIKKILKWKKAGLQRFIVLPDGDIVLVEGNKRLRCVTGREVKSKWVVRIENGYMMKVSPDGMWLAFCETIEKKERYKKIGIFIIKLKEEVD